MLSIILVLHLIPLFVHGKKSYTFLLTRKQGLSLCFPSDVYDRLTTVKPVTKHTCTESQSNKGGQ